MYTRLQIGLWSAAAVLGLACYDSDAATAKGATKAANAQLHHSIMTELRQAKHLLDIGLHDYHGHRAKADHEVGRAIHLLHHHHKGEKFVHKHHHKSPVLHTGPITPDMQQALDSKPRQAQKLIQAAHYQLSQLHTKHGYKHHHEAAHMFTLASHEIEKALHMVHGYNHHHKKAQAAIQ